MSVTTPRGFVAAGLAVGIKGGGALDCAYVGSADAEPRAAAAVFTRSDTPAAPVLVSRTHLVRSQGWIRGVLLTSGNANAATGQEGLEAASRLLARVAELLGGEACDYLIAQTGLIGVPFPTATALDGLEALPKALDGGAEGAARAARAIMTTDSHPKTALAVGEGFTVAGIAKGAAMIAPSMATMLAVITTDAAVSPQRLSEGLAAAVEVSFNRITIDGCMSTNDTVVALASRQGASPGHDFEVALTAVAQDLARQIVGDAEGGSRLGVIDVVEALDEAEALAVARRIAESLLVKASLLGGDPYWGRVLAEVGAAQRGVDPRGVSIWYQDFLVCRGGEDARRGWTPQEHERLAAAMREREVRIRVAIGRGDAAARILTSDLGPGYLEENRRTS